MTALLEVEGLTVSFGTADGVVKAVQNASFSVDAGRTLGVVGESGSGKSVSMQALLGLARGGKVSGQALFRGDDLITMGPEQMRKVRGAQIAMVFQDPLSSLHPHYRVGDQVVEAIRTHESMSKKQALSRTADLFGMVGIPQPKARVHDFPHQFSGGMRQRVMIAMAMSLNPALLIADEPTTALDVTVQAQILELIAKLQQELGMAVIMITHDLGVVADIADEVMVMYAGRPVEVSARDTIYYRAHHPYTEGLLESIPVPGRGTLRPIPGQPPSVINLPPGCSYNPRCRYAMDRCRTELPTQVHVDAEPGHLSACFLPTTGDWQELRHKVEHQPEESL